MNFGTSTKGADVGTIAVLAIGQYLLAAVVNALLVILR